ncbi:zinc protease [Legionella quinlivanii]|uniref:Neutral metalloproteinase n=1 Tax=Legionella quinlivanii TaxID=45073 RepID=A0A364LGJ0_9GAMM|nr:M4 family metallopeptidase [Legionella quinlivanii]RAP35306.1 zinc protease [Legionella quinlivanii]
MHYNLKLSPLAAGLSLIIASSAHAAEPVQLQNASLQNLQQQFHLALPGVQQGVAASDDSLQYLQESTDKNHVNHVRMQQQYAGYNVIGGYAILHSTNAASSLVAGKGKVSMNGKVYSGLKAELGKPSADFIKNGDAALNQFKAQYNSNDVSEEQVTPVVYIDKQNKAHWAYKVSVYVRYDDRIPERPSAILDADTLKPFIQWNDIKTGRAAVKGKGFGGNSKVGEVSYGRDLPLLEITRSKLLNKCYMENKEVRVVDMEHSYYSTNKPMSFSCKKDDGDEDIFWTGYKADGYDRDNGAYSPTNDALYAGYVIKHMYHDWYGVEALKKRDGSPMQLVMRVHYGQGYENAYWDGKQMTFGDGDTFMYPLVSLGVGSHEVSHGFTEQHSGLEYYGQSGGMNESFSDMAAMAAEYYSVGKSSWMIGAEIMKEDSGWETLRYMDVPSKDGMSIDSADEYDSSLDVHFSSGVYNRLYYTLSNQAGWDPKKAFDVMVKANMDYWTPYETFDEGGCGMISAAKDLGYSIEDIKKSLGVVAINYNSCS